jgi:hypothetical protein
VYKKFVIGVDLMKMRLYDVEQSAQNLSRDDDDDTPIMDNTSFGEKKKFDKSKFKDFK